MGELKLFIFIVVIKRCLTILVILLFLFLDLFILLFSASFSLILRVYCFTELYLMCYFIALPCSCTPPIQHFLCFHD